MPITLERVRHELRFRIATVVASRRITPRMARVTVTAADLASFRSDAYDDHVKLFFAPPGETLAVPERTPDGLVFPGGIRPVGRDYTPRAFDPSRAELTIDFVLHGDGPAATWGAAAAPGDTLGIGGPRASFVPRGAADWYLLAGDETALPAIGRRLEELPLGARAIVALEVADTAERQVFSSAAALELHWAIRSAGDSLADLVGRLVLPSGDGYAFVAGEAGASATLRAQLVGPRGLPPAAVRTAGYWRRGEADYDDGHPH